MIFGDYPAKYNPKIHGPYDPVRYYGKPDTPGEVDRIGCLVNVGGMVLFYAKMKQRRNYKYHYTKAPGSRAVRSE
ncbi:putative ATP synthase subunit f, mitochondrial [Aedes aegypti]|uniref:Uncharacterized protein n=1 Tax=Aedes aegypti TaxID=7159 RepID=A0A6I8U9V9_AEDAE|nr:putative ATP synthase subunit f, mitochondrial [Aedes aegypti]